MSKPRVVDAKSIDERLPDGQILIVAYGDGSLHIAFREQEWHSWPKGFWGDADVD